MITDGAHEQKSAAAGARIGGRRLPRTGVGDADLHVVAAHLRLDAHPFGVGSPVGVFDAVRARLVDDEHDVIGERSPIPLACSHSASRCRTSLNRRGVASSSMSSFDGARRYTTIATSSSYPDSGANLRRSSSATCSTGRSAVSVTTSATRSICSSMDLSRRSTRPSVYSNSVEPDGSRRCACGRGLSRYRQWHRVAVGQQLRPEANRWRAPGAVSCAAVVQGLRVRIGDRDEHRGAERIWNELRHRVELFEQPGRFGTRQQECARRCAQLAHHRRGGQAAADAVADDDADPVLADGKHVVEVAADLQWRHRGLVAHGEPGRQGARRQQRALQRQRRLTRDLELPDLLHGQAEMPDQSRDQVAVLVAGPAWNAVLEAHDDVTCAGQHGHEAAGRTRAGCGPHRRDGQGQPVAGVLERPPPILFQVMPVRHRRPARHVDRRVGARSGFSLFSSPKIATPSTRIGTKERSLRKAFRSTDLEKKNYEHIGGINGYDNQLEDSEVGFLMKLKRFIWILI